MIPASGRPKKEAAQGTALQRTRGERSSQKQSRINSRTLWKQSQTRQGSPEPAPVVNNLPQHATELSFSIKRALGARWDLTLSKSTTRPNILNWCPIGTLICRKGWKIMTEDGETLDSNALKTVVGMIKEIEYQVNIWQTFWNNYKRSVYSEPFFIHLQITQLFLKPQGLAVPERITIKVPWRWWFKHYLN